ncbi:MAG TPA: RDD family protein [Pelolinea sp.]|nr:RDD family protein [Pelolinea sp.]
MFKSFTSTQVIEYEQATSLRRIAARLFDGVFSAFVLLPVSGFWVIIDEQISRIAFPISFILLLLAYDTVLIRLFGKTLGKLVFGLQVVNSKGERINWKDSLIRAVLLYLTILLIAFFFFATMTIFGWIFIQGLPKYVYFPHDKAAHDFVVREIKGKLVRSSELTTSLGSIDDKSRISDLERLREQGIISEEEFMKKKEETGL